MKQQLNRFFNKSLIYISLKTRKFSFTIKIQTIIFFVIEVALVIAILNNI
jgi:hypothetical protein